MARNRHVDRARLEMMLGLVGFFAVMAVVSWIGAVAVGADLLLPTVVAVVFVGAELVLLWRWW